MRTLPPIRPTAEQLAIISRNEPGTELIRGAAGSGKTSTAILKLRALIGFYVNRRNRQGIDAPVRVLVLTFNRTLAGYIEELAKDQANEEIDLTVTTFARWALGLIGNPAIASNEARELAIRRLGRGISLPSDYLVEEVEYILGRFPPDRLDRYLEARREGRGSSPRVDREIRVRLLQEVVRPYHDWKEQQGLLDWEDVANRCAAADCVPHDIVVIDEAQDFSANQLRAVTQHLADVNSLTLITDTAQRIYARGFTWQEAGIRLSPTNSRRLTKNYRNTAEIARFALSLLEDLPLDDDGTLPDFTKCERHGDKPIVLEGRFGQQMAWTVDYIHDAVDLEDESVAYLHPRGGGWFDEVRRQLRIADLGFVDITRQSNWPRGPENIALSTLASAKGLEFDYVFLLGIGAQVLPQGEAEDEDDRLSWARRLVAMGIGRATTMVVIGHKDEDASRLMEYFDSDTYERVEL